MRNFARRALLTGLLTAAVVSACRSDDGATATDDLTQMTDRQLATRALQILGAPQVPRDGENQGSCSFTGCHSINSRNLAAWSDSYKEAMAVLDSNDSPEDKINSFRANPRNPRTRFAPKRLGIMAAGAHLGLAAQVNPEKHPLATKQGKALAQLFAGREGDYEVFKKQMLMPVLPQFPRLTPTQYETVLTWMKKGMPLMNELIPEDRPATCQDNFGPLKARTSEVKNKTWAAVNRSRALPMLGCPAPNPENPVSPTKCFTQQREGKDVFPKDEAFQRGWGADGSTVRALRELSAPNSYWLRSSADGRFAATGGGIAGGENDEGGAQAVDLAATMRGEKRDISLNASYDPDFWPDNKAFMFQGGTRFCSQSILEKASTTNVSFGEPECSSLSAAEGLYQTVGQDIGDNSMGDRFILYSIWAGDEGQYSSDAHDTAPEAGGDSAIKIFTAVAEGNDVADGYKVQGEGFDIATPYRGDTMMGRSGHLLGSRWAFSTEGQHGYALEKLDWTLVNGERHFTLEPLGTVCLTGNKANISYDERFLATHHYNTPQDLAGESQDLRDKGSSDIWVTDFVTGKKVKVTKMGPGQFALYAHFRSDGWLYFLVVDATTNKYFVAASDWAVRATEATPTP